MSSNMTIGKKATIFVLLCFGLAIGLPAHSGAQEGGKDKAAPAAEANPLRLAGKWHRTDGNYVLELSDIGFSGTLKAAYFNPKPINVSEAAWRLDEGVVVVFVVLRDVNYPGSTYTLAYFPDRDILAGYYYQAVQGSTFEVVFERPGSPG